MDLFLLYIIRIYMDLKQLPTDIEKIILEYKYQMEHYDKYRYVLCDIKNNLTIRYLVPYLDYDSGYLCRDVRFNKKPFKMLSTVICYCCGRQIYKTRDEYDDENDEEDISINLDYIYTQIIKDNNRNRCIEVENFNDYNYKTLCEELEDEDGEEINLDDMDDEEILEILLEFGESDLDAEEFDELIRELEENDISENE